VEKGGPPEGGIEHIIQFLLKGKKNTENASGKKKKVAWGLKNRNVVADKAGSPLPRKGPIFLAKVSREEGGHAVPVLLSKSRL